MMAEWHTNAKLCLHMDSTVGTLKDLHIHLEPCYTSSQTKSVLPTTHVNFLERRLLGLGDVPNRLLVKKGTHSLLAPG